MGNARFKIENGQPVLTTEANPAEVNAAIARSHGRKDAIAIRPATHRELRDLLHKVTSENGAITRRQRKKILKGE